jgi:hypothetical protein
LTGVTHRLLALSVSFSVLLCLYIYITPLELIGRLVWGCDFPFALRAVTRGGRVVVAIPTASIFGLVPFPSILLAGSVMVLVVSLRF